DLANQLIATGHRIADTAAVRGQDLLDVLTAGVREVADIQASRLGRGSPQKGIETEVAQHEILSPRTPEICGLDAVPPAFGAGESRFFCPIDQLAGFLMEHAHRHPLP